MLPTTRINSSIQVTPTFLRNNGPESLAMSHDRSLIRNDNGKEIITRTRECPQGTLTETST